jgi:hypothetical protein
VTPRGLSRSGIADWAQAGFFYQPSCFFTAEAWGQLGTLSEALEIAFDLDWWLRLATLGEFASIPEILSAATIHAEAKTQKRLLEMEVETILVQVAHGYRDAASRRLERFTEKSSSSRAREALRSLLLHATVLFRELAKMEGTPSHIDKAVAMLYAEEHEI